MNSRRDGTHCLRTAPFLSVPALLPLSAPLPAGQPPPSPHPTHPLPASPALSTSSSCPPVLAERPPILPLLSSVSHAECPLRSPYRNIPRVVAYGRLGSRLSSSASIRTERPVCTKPNQRGPTLPGRYYDAPPALAWLQSPLYRTHVYARRCVSAGERDRSQLEDRSGVPREELREPPAFNPGKVFGSSLAYVSIHVLLLASPDGRDCRRRSANDEADRQSAAGGCICGRLGEKY